MIVQISKNWEDNGEHGMILKSLKRQQEEIKKQFIEIKHNSNLCNIMHLMCQYGVTLCFGKGLQVKDDKIWPSTCLVGDKAMVNQCFYISVISQFSETSPKMTAHIHKTAMSPNMKPKVYLHNVVTSCVH